MENIVRGVHAFIALGFLVVAALQFNDPDPIYWILVYVLVAAIPAGKIFDRKFPRTLMVASGMVLAGLLISGPGFIDYLTSTDYAAIGGSMMDAKPYVEFAREFIGLFFAGVCLIYYGRTIAIKS